MDLRRTLKAKLGTRPEHLGQHRFRRWLGHRLHDPNLWHFGRRSVARATGVGLCLAFFPIPIHMLLVAPIAIALGINLPVLIAATWITNPITWVPIFYFAYRLGAYVTGTAPIDVDALSLGHDWQGLRLVFARIWLPLCTGAAICGGVCGTLGYFGVECLWRLGVARRWRAREAGRAARH